MTSGCTPKATILAIFSVLPEISRPETTSKPWITRHSGARISSIYLFPSSHSRSACVRTQRDQNRGNGWQKPRADTERSLFSHQNQFPQFCLLWHGGRFQGRSQEHLQLHILWDKRAHYVSVQEEREQQRSAVHCCIWNKDRNNTFQFLCSSFTVALAKLHYRRCMVWNAVYQVHCNINGVFWSFPVRVINDLVLVCWYTPISVSLEKQSSSSEQTRESKQFTHRWTERRRSERLIMRWCRA